MLKLIPKHQNGLHIVKSGGLIKKIAHAVNLHGNKQIYKLYSFDDFKNYYFRTRKNSHENPSYPLDKLNWTILVEKKARLLYLEQYGESYPFFPGPKSQENYSKIFDKVLKEYYDQYLKNNPVPNTTNNLYAAKLSILGGAMTAIPHPVTRIPGTLLMIPDYIYDAALAIDEPKPSNIAHNVVDYAPYLGKLIPGSYDDLLLHGLNLIGNVDDAVSANGNDVFNFLNPKSQLNSRKVKEPVSKGDRTDR